MADHVAIGERLCVRMRFDVVEAVDDAVVELGISGPDGDRVVTAQNVDRDGTPYVLEAGAFEVEARLGIALLPGEFQLDVGVHRIGGLTFDFVEGALSFSVIKGQSVICNYRGQSLQHLNFVIIL